MRTEKEREKENRTGEHIF